jgi:ABC-2 type transport system ATP-binding protein
VAGVLEIDSVSRRFGAVMALDKLSFRVPSGQVVGFLGPNGAGKTTTMRAIFGLTDVNAGSVRWNGAPVERAQRRRFGYMPEERGLYPSMPVAEQIEYLGRLHGMDRAAAASATTRWLERLEVADRATSKVEELSHGNQQRVQLAAALVHDPEALVLDEPLAGLDPSGIDVIGDVLVEQAHAGRCVLFSSHQLDLVEDVCQDVVVIDQGRIVLSGAVETLKSAARHRSLEISVDGNPWVPTVPEVAVTRKQDGRLRVLVDADVDLQAILAEDRRAGEVTLFSFEPPSVSDLFHEAVSEGGGV